MKREKKRLDIEKETLRNLSREFNLLKKLVKPYTGKKLFWDIWTGNWNKFIYKTDCIINSMYRKKQKENSRNYTTIFIKKWRPIVGDKINGKVIYIKE